MTMPTAPGSPTDGGYEPDPRRVVLVISDGIDAAPILWRTNEPHPAIPEMTIIAMYLNSTVVEIYSSDKSSKGIRETIPIDRTRLIRETMPIGVWASELRHAELGYPEDDDDDDEVDDEDPEEPDVAATVPPPSAVSSNGQATP